MAKNLLMEMLKSTNNYLIIIVGPTAIGKTALSIELAKHFNCDIVSCDSRQFYKEMTIGTAVPSTDELKQATHHFIQNKSITENYSVGDYEKEVLPLLDALFLKNNIQIVVGGSGLYVDAILKGFDDFPDVSDKIKAEINKNYQENGFEYLQEKLQQLDPFLFRFFEDNQSANLSKSTANETFYWSFNGGKCTLFIVFKSRKKQAQLHSYCYWFRSSARSYVR